MKKLCLLCFLFAACAENFCQTVPEKLKFAISILQKDPQLRHGMLSLYVADGKTGASVFDFNSQVGLAPASIQKIITSVTSFELLKSNFRFSTYIHYDGDKAGVGSAGNLVITGTGDPTLGSWRWDTTKEDAILNRLTQILIKNSISKIPGDIIIDDFSYTVQPVPGGWIWEDIGNYYGAGCWSLNWRENQYDLVLKSGNTIGERTSILSTKPLLHDFQLANYITSARKGSGDNGYIYAAPFSRFGYATGTIPVEERSFTISGSMPRPALQFAKAIEEKLKAIDIRVNGTIKLYSDFVTGGKVLPKPVRMIDSILSPTLDSINYWFMKKSINLYGEALVKALAYNNQPAVTTTENGVDIIKDFWSTRGIEKTAINIVDGSGLSPQNRVTTHALVTVMQYAKTRPWYRSFYLSLPEFNGMKIKSGSIGGGRSFAGYHRSTTGKEYVFAIIVNNYNGSSSEIVRKMYRVLDVLK